MKLFQTSCAIGLLFIVSAAGAGAGSGASGPPGPANRIVGLWGTEAVVGPCNASPVMPIRNTLLFQAGGTVIENPRFPPAGAPNVAGVPGVYQRGLSLGTWSYDPVERRYFVHVRFDNYVDSVYHGYSTVDREIVLSKQGLLASGPVRSARFMADGTLMSEVCGQAISARL
jgi:hypothetical protein